MKIRFEEKGKKITCVIRLETGKTFAGVWSIKSQADRVDEKKRAKHSAYLSAMHKVLGYSCDRINKIEEI